MGKLGAGELNYSSDIDLILLYDRDAPALAGNEQISRHFVRGAAPAGAAHVGDVGRRLHLPHRPAAAPRSRLDAARHVGAGGRTLLRERRPELGARRDDQGASRGRQPRPSARPSSPTLRPYIWRKHLDFAAIHDIHSIKRQIDAHRGGGTVKVLGHNVKLGRGGIREIEFFAQTQQLIFGGRNPVAAAARHLRDAARAGGGRPRRAERGRRADRGLRLPAPGRASPADGRRPPDPQPARPTRPGVAAIATFLGYRRRRRPSRQALLATPALRRGPLRAACSRRRRASPARAATWSSPAPTTIPARSRP